jgi:periplasmic protein TonB
MVQWAASGAIHLLALAVTTAVISTRGVPAPADSIRAVTPIADDRAVVLLPRIVFQLPREGAGGGGGGGGGGNRDRGPIRRAQARGHDDATLRTRRTVPTTGTTGLDDVDRAPAVLLDARPLASGDSVHAGLPLGGVSYGTSQGPGSGGGVGTGRGTGIGSGDGPGIGPGSGGGSGGGVYRPGNGVTAPRVLKQQTPRYTSDALLHKIQGAVWLDAVVTRDGTPANIRVARSLDPGLDGEAIAALQQWRFAPGTLGGSPVDVEVVVVMNFWIR